MAYVVLPSNSSLEYFPNNTLANFNVRLGKPLILDGAFEVALVEIIYPNKRLTVEPADASMKIYLTKIEKIKLPELPMKPKEPAKEKDKVKYKAARADYKKKIKNFKQTLKSHKNEVIKLVGTKISKELFKLKTFPTVYEKKKIVTSTRTLKAGVYNNAEEINEQVQEITNTIESLNISLDKQTDLFTVTIDGEKIKKVELSLRMAELLGFKGSTQGYTISKTEKATLQPQLEGNTHSLYIYSSLVDNQLVGDTVAPLLRVVCPPGEKIGQQVSEKYIKPYYLPVHSNYIDTIDIQIRTTTGFLFPFMSGSPVVISLHFRKVGENG